VLSFSHFGVCVSDLARSLRFYVEALGFEPGGSHEVGPEFAGLMEVDGARVRSKFLRRDGVSMELLHFDEPGHAGEGRRRAMNQLGLTHLCFRVDDVDAVASRIEELGGTVHPDTRTTLAENLDFVYCTDPDGTRIELMRLG
jgi:glyoxylase I family protein